MHRLEKQHISFLSCILKFSLVMMVLFLSACQQSPPRLNIQNDYTEKDLFYDEWFSAIEPLPVTDEIFELTPEQERDFMKAYNSFSYRALSGSERIYKYLESKLQNFNFQADTLMASESLSQSTGNCLSLAIVTRALAKLVNVGTNFELARTEPIYQLENNIQLESDHIRTVVYVKEVRNTRQYVNPNYKIRIDYFPAFGSRTLRRVHKDEFFAMFYTNRAAEAIIHDQTDQAYWHIKTAIKLQPNNLRAINMLGVLYRRLGNEQVAEKVFKYGLSIDPYQLELLNNYQKLLVKSNRMDEANIIADLLKNHNEKDPFNWIDLANAELNEMNYSNAIKYFKRATELADNLHQPYAGMAQAHFLLGRPNQALKAMDMAMVKTKHIKTKSFYQAKYDYYKSNSNIN